MYNEINAILNKILKGQEEMLEKTQKLLDSHKGF